MRSKDKVYQTDTIRPSVFERTVHDKVLPQVPSMLKEEGFSQKGVLPHHGPRHPQYATYTSRSVFLFLHIGALLLTAFLRFY